MKPKPVRNGRPGASGSPVAVIAPLALLCVLLAAVSCRPSAAPAAIDDREFWRLVDALSEAPGTFSISENLVSNEPYFADTVRVLRRTGGVYVGVGPEQNFSYIARLRPSVAFIVDIRRENRNLHLLYKALFELSIDRADFVSRLFSRPRPADLETSARVDDIFSRYETAPASREVYATNRSLVRERLVVSHGFPLSPIDLEDIDRALTAFYGDGPDIHFWGSRNDDAAGPSYRLLMTAKDIRGQSRSYLSDEDAFRFVKDLQSRNLVVPVIGDFAGSKAIREVGDLVRERGDAVQAFYGSNVGIYLTNQQTGMFCGNLATLPIGPRAVFIESNGMRPLSHKLAACRGVGK